MVSLKVPALKQPKGSVLCGPTCARMVLAYYGTNMSLSRIASEMKMIKTGIDLGSMGRFFLEKGFRTRLSFWIDGMEPRWFGADNPDELRKILNCRICNSSRRTWDFYRKRLIKYMDAGGELELMPAMPSRIAEELSRKHPVIININSRIMRSVGRASRGHYVVLNYMSRTKSQVPVPMIGYLDPHDGEQYFDALEKMMFYCHIWEGGCLFIEPK